ncbi:unnamed protein product, partial [Amoebophrya sp. A120]|eukprot:GSA120T00024027001.1
MKSCTAIISVNARVVRRFVYGYNFKSLLLIYCIASILLEVLHITSQCIMAKQSFHFRAAVVGDVEAIAKIWYDVYQISHAHLVPPELLQHRTLETFRQRTPGDLAKTLVAVTGSSNADSEDSLPEGQVCGFVSTRGTAILHLFVGLRGCGVGRQLLQLAERQIFHDASGSASSRPDADGSTRCEQVVAHLHVVHGNEAARQFYKKCGWVEVGEETYEVEILAANGGTEHFPVPCLRWEKKVSANEREGQAEFMRYPELKAIRDS